MTKALCPDMLLAFEMNGELLAPEHGFPLRVVVPGFAGVRSPKWLAGVTVQATPSGNPMQQTDYKLFPPNVTPASVDWTMGITINEMPLNAARSANRPMAPR
jgi:sulfite oxidase